MTPQPATVTVEVVRAFWYGGIAHAVGTRLTLPASLAHDLIGARKARVVPAQAPLAEPAEPDPTPTQPAAARRKAKDAPAP